MSNYQQTSITGESWIRAVRVVLENPLIGTPAATFVEERAINLGSETLVRPHGNLVEPFIASGDGANLTETFDLLNPDTGAVIGSATYQEVYAMLHSLYYHVAAKRDAGGAAV